jgi:hypothetical protein
VLGRADLDARRHPGHRQPGGQLEVAAVRTAWTPVRALAAEASIDTIRAWASVERTIAA